MQLPHKKKTMSGSAKGKKGKQRNNSKKNQSTMYDGCYGNTRLAHVLLSLMGKDCQAKLRNNTVYEGLFHSFSQQMELSLNAVNRRNVDTMNGTKHQASESPKEVDLVNECVFRFDNIVSMQFPNVDLDYAVQDVNETNGEMAASQQRGMKSFEKKLEPWNGGGDSLDADSMAIGGLESSGIDGTNGWDASDMFKANEEKYGVKSDYDSSLPSYTMALNINEEKPEKIARATRLAQEIEGSSDYRQRVDLEVDDGLTEEDKFSAVVRDREFRRDGRGSRDSHDRDNDHPLFREREKSDRDREQGIPPYRNNRDYNEKFRGRGARMREFQQRTQQGYSGPMGHSRQMGPGGPPGGDRRNQMSMAQMDGSGPQAKFNRNVQQANIPPRFSKTGSGGGHSREDERMKQSDNPMHSSYQPPKHQRQPRMNNRMSGNRTWSNPSGNEYMHHNPTQMHTDSPAMVGVPQNGSGPNLSRTSSSSSNTSAPMQQGHRKQHSTSSQDDQPPHPAHIRQSSRHSSSPTGGPVAPNPQPPLPRSQVMPVSMQTSSHQEISSVQSNSLSSTAQHPETATAPKSCITIPKILKRGTTELLVTEENSENEKRALSDQPVEKTVVKSAVHLKDRSVVDGLRALPNEKFRHDGWNDDTQTTIVSQKKGSDSPPGSIEPEAVPYKDNRESDHQIRVKQHVIEGTLPHLVPIINRDRVRFSISNSHCLRRNHYQYRPVFRGHQTFLRHPTPNLQYVILHHLSTAQFGSDDHILVQSSDPPSSSWAAAVARGNMKQPPLPTTADMTRGHMTQQSQQGIPQTSQGDNPPIHVRPNVTYTWTPPPNNAHYSQMSGPRGPVQMMARSHNPPPGAVPGPQQQTILQRQQMPPQNIHPPPNSQALSHQVNQQQPKNQNNTPTEPGKHHAQKAEESKSLRKTSEAVQSVSATNTKSGDDIKELQEFRRNFKLSNEVNKESANSLHSQNKATPRQAPPNAPPQHVGQQHAYQQQGVDISQQQHPATGNRPEHAVPQVMTVPGGTPSIHPGQVAGPQLVKHQGPQQPVMVAHHSHQIPPSPITQQIPVASPGIQHFATPSQHAPMQGQPIIAGRMPIDKNNMPAMQKTITSPKAENAYPPAPNIHIAVSQVPQTMPSAVYSVSAANPSPVASSHYQPPVTLTAVSALKNQGQSPVVASQVSSPLVPSMESSAKTAPVDVDLSEQGGKQLNPEAVEFKPRSSTKIATAVVAARTNTPVPQQQQFIPQGQMLTQMPQLVAPGQMYPGQLAPIDPMNPPMQMMQMIPPPYFPQMVAGQQMPQYLEQMYQAHNTQQMIPANARVAAMQSNPPQHMSQFTPDQAQPQMYVPMQQQPYMTQARPHSAHTPTQVSHVTATSPASQTIQQPPQAVNHPPSMVQAPHPTGQQPIYFVPHQHMGPQPPVQTQYITTVPSAVMPSSVAMTNVTPQQKGQHQQVAYVAQASARQYAPYSAAPST